MMALSTQQPAMSLQQLLSGLGRVKTEADPVISGISLDSREIRPGWLFLACSGGRGHGLDFAEEARARGAVAILAEPDRRWDTSVMAELARSLHLPVVPFPRLRRRASALADRYFGEPSKTLEVMGVTGTNGKTSVTHYLAQALARECACAIVGTVGIGFPEDLAPASMTTPDPVRLQQTLGWLREQGAAAVAMEVSSHALAQGRADGVRFSHAIFTNLSRDHLDYHGDMAAYGKAKRELFRMPGLRWAVVNLDDPLAADIMGDLDPSVALACYSLSPRAPIPDACRLWLRAPEVTPGPAGLQLKIETSAGAGAVEVGLVGRFNAANLLAVLAVLLSRGMPFEQAMHALARVRGVPGRMERFGGGDLPIVVVDYAHTPDALHQALGSAREHTDGQLICVFGCGGERDPGKRPLMGAVAERLSDRLILTDDNPRGEDGSAIIEQIMAGICDPTAVRVERRRALAIRAAIATAAIGDLVLVAGKGHETTQDLGELKVHFSDRAQVQQALSELSGPLEPDTGAKP
jgi:UDP-N-acetylmuramoyl-L-alanyl-D-glutamate--2,6-diaminopimelate ligase